MKVEIEILENGDIKYKNHTIKLCYDSDTECDFYDVDDIFNIEVPFGELAHHAESYLKTLKEAIKYIDELEENNESL